MPSFIDVGPVSKQVNKFKNTPYVGLLGESQAQLRSRSGN